MIERETVLVTGGAGCIGSDAVLALRDAWRTPVVVDNLSTGRRCASPSDVPFVEGDAVMHFAGSIGMPESVKRPFACFRNSTLNSHALLEACVSRGADRVIVFFPAAVYGMPDMLPVREEASTPPNLYGAFKLMTEWIQCDAAAVHGLRCVALRSSTSPPIRPGAPDRVPSPNSRPSSRRPSPGSAIWQIPQYSHSS